MDPIRLKSSVLQKAEEKPTALTGQTSGQHLAPSLLGGSGQQARNKQDGSNSVQATSKLSLQSSLPLRTSKPLTGSLSGTNTSGSTVSTLRGHQSTLLVRHEKTTIGSVAQERLQTLSATANKLLTKPNTQPVPLSKPSVLEENTATMPASSNTSSTRSTRSTHSFVPHTTHPTLTRAEGPQSNFLDRFAKTEDSKPSILDRAGKSDDQKQSAHQSSTLTTTTTINTNTTTSLLKKRNETFTTTPATTTTTLTTSGLLTEGKFANNISSQRPKSLNSSYVTESKTPIFLEGSRFAQTGTSRFHGLPNRFVAPSTSVGTVEPAKNDKEVKVAEVPPGTLVEKPSYDFTAVDKSWGAHIPIALEQDPWLDYEEDNTGLDPEAPSPVNVNSIKQKLLNAVSAALIHEPDFYNPTDETRRNIVAMCDDVGLYDPEFLLKLALYTRNHLNVRMTANFLLTFAATRHYCRPFLRKYFNAVVRLPTDWLEVSQLYQSFHDPNIKFKSLPAALRKALVDKFPEFDEYQLAKYNKDKAKSQRKKAKAKAKIQKSLEERGTKTSSEPTRGRGRGGRGRERGRGRGGVSINRIERVDKCEPSASEADSESDEETRRPGASVPVGLDEEEKQEQRVFFTIKQIVRKCHISEPPVMVMSIIGKKYPSSLDEFYQSHLPGTWDEARAGKRMKLKTPETWETQVSQHGNKAATWEKLLDNRKLPYMATLRNIRNLIKAGISPKHHKMVIRRLQDRVSVINSKQFPFSFFTAYDVIKELDSAEHQKLVADYQKALDNAVIVSTQYNLKPVKGCTIILCCVDDSMNGACGSAKGMGKPKSLREVGLLLGLMCANACEKAQLYVYWTHPWPECVPVQLEEGTILENMESVLKVVGTEEERMKDHPPMADYDLPVPEGLLRILTKDRVWVDNFMILASGHRSGYDTQWCNMVKRYRHLVNSDILIVDVDLTGRPAENKLVDDDTTVPENTIRIAGYSAQILQFIAERGDDSQLTFVDKIDTMYDLQRKPVNRSLLQPVVEKLPKYDLPIQAPLFTPGTSDWRHVRVFISSTFRDMHGERDMLTRYVFPELRRRAKAHRIHVHEVDLRWGMTEAEASSDKLLEICLSEIDKCRPFFIGILGNRYGYTPQTYTPTPLLETQPQFDWLKTYPPGRSVTELEFQYGALRAPDNSKGRAFMYIRDNSFMKDVPAAYTKDFESENPQAAEKISMLKEQVRGSGLLAVDGYSCEWGAVVDGVPLVTGLETFGLSVLGNLWDAILDFAKEGTQQTADMQKPRYVEMLDREQYLHHLYVEHRLATFAGRERMLKELHRLVKDADTQVPGGVVSVAGHPGSGKTSFMSAFAFSMAKTKHPATVLLTHFVGASPQSDDVRQMLNRLCHELRRRLALPDEIPEEYPALVKMFQHLLVESSVRVTANGGQIVLVIDGVDELSATYNAQSMDWLPPPDQLPAGVVIIVSVVESTLTSNTGQCARALRSRTPSALELVMGPLEALEKAEVARKVLGQYRKTLSEDPFDNQMRLLTGKKEAASPLFLVLACEELRTFGVFEKLTPFIKEIRQTTKELLQQLLGRMEADHGVPLVKMATSLLAMSRRGLLESEVVGMLGMASADLADLPVVKWCRLYHGLAPFLKPAIHGSESDTLLAFFHQEFTNAVMYRYFHGPVSVKQVHVHMARYFEMAADPRLDGSYVGADARALSELPYHLLGAGKYEEAERMLCSLGFIEAKCKAHMSYDLLGDYVAALAAASPSTNFPSASAEKSSVPSQLEVYRGFVARNSHILAQMPSLTLQQALNEPDWSPVAQTAKTHLEDAPGRMMFRWRNKQQTLDPNIQRMTGFSQAMLCLATSPNGSQLACGSADGTVFLFEMATGKELAQLHGAHANAVTSICYVGSTLLCSASRDGSIFLWKLSGLSASKVGKLDKHTRQASAVCANTQGDLLLTAGWDGALHMWNPADGSHLGQLCDGHHPINTVAFHPEGRLAATGNWGGQIVIWDTFNRTMLKTLSPRFNPPLPSCSIRSVSFSPNGTQLLSADMNGTLAMWSVASGTCLSSVGASYLPINRCVFSPSGNELACVSDDPTVQVVTGRLGRGTSARPTRDMGPLLCIAMNPVYTVCAVGGHHQMCAVYNTMDGTWSYLPEHDSAVTAVEWAGDGLILVTGTASGVLRSFALHPGQEPQLLSTCDRSNSGHSGAITHVSIYGTTVVSASADFTLGLWNLDSGVLEAVTHLRGHDNTVTCSDWLPTQPGKVLASVSRDRSLCIWQIDGTQRHLILRREEAHSDSVTCCAYSPNGSILATGSNDFTIVLWSVGDYAKMCALTGHLGIVTSLHFLTDETLLSSSFDLTVRAWSTGTRDEITTLQGHTLAVNALTSLPAHCENGSFISCGDDGQLCTWVIGWGRFRPYSGHGRRVCAATFADNTTLVTASHDHSISVWRAGLVQSQLLPNPTGGDEKAQAGQYGSMDAPHSFKGTGCVAVSRDGQYVVTGGATTMCLWMFGNDSPSTTLTGLGQINALCFVDPTTVAAVTNDTTMLILTWSHPYDMAVCNSFDLHCAGPNTRLPLTATAYCPDMGLIAVGGWAGHVDMYSISQNDVVMTLHGDGRGGWVTYLEVLHTGHHLAVCTDIGAVAIWDLTTQTQLHGINTPHWVTCAVVCSPDFAIVWYFTRLGATYPADFEAGDKQSLHQKSITAAHYHSPTGTLLTASEDGTLKAWRYSPQPNYPANKTLENLDPATGFSAGISGISTPLSSGSLSSVRMVEHVSWVQIGCSVAKGPLTSLAVALTQGGLLCVAGDSLGHVYHLTFSLPEFE